jgi:dihydrofolate reductase
MSDSELRTPNSELRTLSIIAAVSENNVIGRGGGLPWHLAVDLKRFKRLTMGHAIIMGRRTWESIGRPLPGRTSIVISRQTDWRVDGASVAASLDGALEIARRSKVDQSEAFVIGGAAVYALALPRAERLYLTRVHAVVEGDVEFPAVDWNAWRLMEESHHAADERNDFDHTFQVWLRKA